MSLKALIFDVDGTLADTELKGHRVAYNRAFKKMAIPWYWSETIYGEILTVSGGKERMKHFVENYQPEIPPGSVLDELIPAIYASKTEIFRDMLLTGMIPLRSGVERLFNEARQAGIRLAIATTTAPSNVQYLLTSTLGKESLDWFDIIAAGDIVDNKKPSGEIYQLVLDEMGWQADECVAFEDSENGCLSARDAGLPVIITVTSYTHNESFIDADLVLDQFGNENDAASVIDDPSEAFDEPMLTIDYLIKKYS